LKRGCRARVPIRLERGLPSNTRSCGKRALGSWPRAKGICPAGIAAVHVCGCAHSCSSFAIAVPLAFGMNPSLYSPEECGMSERWSDYDRGSWLHDLVRLDAVAAEGDFMNRRWCRCPSIVLLRRLGPEAGTALVPIKKFL